MLKFLTRKEDRPHARKFATLNRPLLFISLALLTTAGATFAVASRSGRNIISVVERRLAASGAPLSGHAEPSAAQQKEAAQKDGPLVGANFRISQISSVGQERDASSPDTAYNPDDNEYLVVWMGNGLAQSLGVAEIFGRRIKAATGESVGADFRISNMSDGGKGRSGYAPKVVYNPTSHEYLVVWHGQAAPDSPDSVLEIHGQRLSRTGDEVGKDFRISTTTDLGKIMGSFVRASAHADLAWNSTDNQYLVVWDAMGQPEELIRTEIYGQLLDASGTSLGKNFRISNTNDQGAEFNANAPAVAYNSTNNQYLVVWSGPFKQKSQNEVWAQAVSASGAQVGKGTGDFTISQVSTNIGADRDASAPKVAYNSSSNEYLVVFQANAVAGVDNAQANEVFGQRINAATLAETGSNDFRISNTPGSFMNRADNPRVAFNAKSLEYMVVWRGVRTDVPFEIFGQRLSLEGSEIEADFQVSSVASIGKDRTVNMAAIAPNSASGEYLAVWHGDGLIGPNAKGVNEIFGQRIKPAARR
ncbi:MAG TPA: hypothetical protein VF735_00575 [Pyrinomonadaceae bacterium]|jgi:hypothetical protein